jgi:hypothetical protein
MEEVKENRILVNGSKNLSKKRDISKIENSNIQNGEI